MALDLFSASAHFDRMPIPDAEIFYLPHLKLSEPDASVLQRLIAEVPWRAEQVVLWGKKMAQPRLIAWYGDSGKSYTYSGIQLFPMAWTPMLMDVRSRIEGVANTAFNSVLLNYYRDHRDSMGFHSDDEPELGPRPVIASLSLGEERTFILEHKSSKVLRPVHLRLASGSVLVMKGDTQRFWKHGIPKETRSCGARVNLTFRFIAR